MNEKLNNTEIIQNKNADLMLDIERPSGSQEIEKRAEALAPKKTPEELRAENVERLTQRAMNFIAEKKVEREKEEIRKKIEETRIEEKIPEGNQGKDQEQTESKSKRFIANLKDKYRLAVFKNKGVENPQEMLKLIQYLEENIPDRKWIKTSESKAERVRKKYFKEGYRECRSYNDNGKVEFLFVKDNHGYRFEKSDIKDLNKLLDKPNDIKKTVEELKQLGEVSPYLFPDYSDKIRELLEIPEAPLILKKLHEAGVNFGYISNVEIERLNKVVAQEASNPILTSPIKKMLANMLAESKGRMNYDLAEKFLDIAQNEKMRELLPILIESDLVNKYSNVAIMSEAFSDETLAESLILAHQLGINLKVLNLEALVHKYENYKRDETENSKQEYEQSLEKYKKILAPPVVKEMIGNENAKKIIDNVLMIWGRRCSITELGCAATIGKNPKGLATLEFLRENQLLPSEKEDNRKDNMAKVSEILGNEKVMKLIFQPDFQDFAAKIEKTFSIKSGPNETWNPIWNDSFLLNAYEDTVFKERLLSSEGMELTKFIYGSEPLNSSGISMLKKLLSCPGIINTLKSLDTYFGFKYDVRSGYHVGDEMIINMHKNYEQRERIFSQENVAYVKKIYNNPGLENIIYILRVNRDLLPLLVRLKDQLNYCPEFDNLGNLEGEDILTSILKNENIQKEIFSKERKELFERLKYAKKIEHYGITALKIEEFLKTPINLEATRITEDSLKIGEIFSGRLNNLEVAQNFKTPDIPELSQITKEHLDYFQGFKEKYALGNKGETILALLAMREGQKLLESEGKFSWRKIFDSAKAELEKYQKTIEKNTFDKIPQGLRASIGMEYEVTDKIKDEYESNRLTNYKDSIIRASKYAKIGQGADGVHEIATQPTDNPYLMLLEMKLLQDLEYIDFNFRPAEKEGYYGAAQGYHLSLGGEQGVNANHNAYFLSNLVNATNWGGANFGREIYYFRGIRPRGTDSKNVFLLENQSSSVEIKDFSIDRWEPFERTVLTCYNGAIAIQAAEHYTKINYQQIKELNNNFPSSSEELMAQLAEKDLIKEPVNDSNSKELIFIWLKLQTDMLKVIEDHNENFLTNETVGYADKRTGQWVDSKEVSGRNNQRYFQEGLRNLNKSRSKQIKTIEEFFEKELKINPDDIFSQLKNETFNSLTYIGNLFLTKFSNFSQTKNNIKEKERADPNVLSFLTNTRENGLKNEKRNLKDVEKSVFEREDQPSQGYYYLQGGSEKLIIHQAQKLALEFNKNIANLLSSKTSKQEKTAEGLAVAA
ncbi:MAG: hypothetical protein Q7S18_03445 [bacterium]|nr:hypothetical protein [bacterium]